MPRGPRIDAPGVIQHVIVRGVDRRTLFADEIDRRDLLRRLSTVMPESSCTCFAWALMSNHIHLVVETGASPLARVMARVGTGYASYFNRRHGRVGHLVQNRYLSRVVSSDDDLLNLIRYVHLNPVRAGMVGRDQLTRFPWTGHAALMGELPPQPFHDCRATLGMFREDPNHAREALRAFMDLALADRGRRRPPLDLLIEEVARSFGVDVQELVRGERDRMTSRARGVVAYRACTELGLSRVEVALALGVGPSAVGRAVRRVAREKSRLRTVPESGSLV